MYKIPVAVYTTVQQKKLNITDIKKNCWS